MARETKSQTAETSPAENDENDAAASVGAMESTSAAANSSGEAAQADPAKKPVWPLVELYTDGACSGNPGPGGWAFILRHVATQKEKEVSGAERETTNNQMELLAVIRGLEALRSPCRVHLFTDSTYVGKGLTEWLAGWKRRGWKRDGKPIKNIDLWKRLDELAARHQLKFTHVRGHSGHPENERCDELAVAAYRNLA